MREESPLSKKGNIAGHRGKHGKITHSYRYVRYFSAVPNKS